MSDNEQGADVISLFPEKPAPNKPWGEAERGAAIQMARDLLLLGAVSHARLAQDMKAEPQLRALHLSAAAEAFQASGYSYPTEDPQP